jgi:NADH-quinone oxidoreductase subunit J
MNPDLILFLILATVAIIAALGMLFSRNAVYSALYLILNFITVAVFYLLLGAPLIAMVQITVYAGAIMVLFLFVIMLLGAEQLRRSQTLGWQQPLAFVLALVLMVEAVYILVARSDLLPVVEATASGYGDPESVGLFLFQHYLLPFEITSVLLLAAMVGVIVMTRRRKKDGEE